MPNVSSFYRWFRDIPIARKLYFTVGTMALLIGVELFVLLFSLNTLSSLRAYVGGEGLWSKAQKDAVFHLYRYGVARTDQDYRLFEQFMRVPLGDAKTRLELLKATPNIEVARQGFLEGRNHPDDVDGMISLFIDFSGISYIRKAINIWSDAQPMAEQLLTIAQKMREEIHSPHPSQDRIDQFLASVYTIDQRLTALEDQFSFTLGDGSRWLESVVLRLLFATALTVETTGLLLIFSVSKAIQQGLASIIRAAKEFATGQFGARANVLSRDEIGVVAKSFNEMANNLQKRVRELADLNRDKEHEIAERKRAETELREAFALLDRHVNNTPLAVIEWKQDCAAGEPPRVSTAGLVGHRRSLDGLIAMYSLVRRRSSASSTKTTQSVRSMPGKSWLRAGAHTTGSPFAATPSNGRSVTANGTTLRCISRTAARSRSCPWWKTLPSRWARRRTPTVWLTLIH